MSFEELANYLPNLAYIPHNIAVFSYVLRLLYPDAFTIVHGSMLEVSN